VSEVFTGQVDVVEVRRPDVIVFAHGPPGAGGGTSPEVGVLAHGPGAGVVGPEVSGVQVLIIRLNANTGEIVCGGDSRAGTLRLLNGLLKETVTLDATFSNLRMGGNGSDGDILLYAGAGDRNDNGAATIHLDGEAGDILFRNGDCAEEFDFAEPDLVQAGSVVALADDGKLHLARHPYDRRVAGIVSGGGDTRPGIILGRDPTRRSRLPVALAGRVQCWVDASYSPVDIGDLLTTSATPGHAMRAADPAQAFGSVIGKAMGSLRTGAGLVPVLVALQ
jgi:hypothetical protein